MNEQNETIQDQVETSMVVEETKVEQVVETVVETQTETTERVETKVETVKKSRGRPKKEKSEDETVNLEKRGRGRPKKYTDAHVKHLMDLVAATGRLDIVREIINSSGLIRHNLEQKYAKQFGLDPKVLKVSKELFKGAWNVSETFLCLKAKEFGVKVTHGRPKFPVKEAA